MAAKRCTAAAIGTWDNRFITDRLAFITGSKISIEIDNPGQSRHEFAIPRLGLSTGTILPGELVHATFVVSEGFTEFVCRYHGGMRGEIAGFRDWDDVFEYYESSD